jgi:hypothetical protein
MVIRSRYDTWACPPLSEALCDETYQPKMVSAVIAAYKIGEFGKVRDALKLRD